MNNLFSHLQFLKKQSIQNPSVDSFHRDGGNARIPTTHNHFLPPFAQYLSQACQSSRVGSEQKFGWR